MPISITPHYAKYLFKTYRTALRNLLLQIPESEKSEKKLVLDLIRNLKEIASIKTSEEENTSKVLVQDIEKIRNLAKKYPNHIRAMKKLADMLEDQRMILRVAGHKAEEKNINQLAIDFPSHKIRDAFIEAFSPVEINDEKNQIKIYKQFPTSLYLSAHVDSEGKLIVHFPNDKVRKVFKNLLGITDSDAIDMTIKGEKAGLAFKKTEMVSEKRMLAARMLPDLAKRVKANQQDTPDEDDIFSVVDQEDLLLNSLSKSKSESKNILIYDKQISKLANLRNLYNYDLVFGKNLIHLSASLICNNQDSGLEFVNIAKNMLDDTSIKLEYNSDGTCQFNLTKFQHDIIRSEIDELIKSSGEKITMPRENSFQTSTSASIVINFNYARYLLQDYENFLIQLEKHIPSSDTKGKEIVTQLIKGLKRISELPPGKLYDILIENVNELSDLAKKYPTHATNINDFIEKLQNQHLIMRYSVFPPPPSEAKEQSLAIDCPNPVIKYELYKQLGAEKNTDIRIDETKPLTLYMNVHISKSGKLIAHFPNKEIIQMFQNLMSLYSIPVKQIKLTNKTIGLEFSNSAIVTKNLRIARPVPAELNVLKQKSKEIADFKSLPYFGNKKNETDHEKLKRFLEYFKDVKPEPISESQNISENENNLEYRFKFNNYNLIFMWMSFISVLVKYRIVPIKIEDLPYHESFMELMRGNSYFYFDLHSETFQKIKNYLKLSEKTQLRLSVEKSALGVEREFISDMNKELSELESHDITETTQEKFFRDVYLNLRKTQNFFPTSVSSSSKSQIVLTTSEKPKSTSWSFGSIFKGFLEPGNKNKKTEESKKETQKASIDNSTRPTSNVSGVIKKESDRTSSSSPHVMVKKNILVYDEKRSGFNNLDQARRDVDSVQSEKYDFICATESDAKKFISSIKILLTDNSRISDLIIHKNETNEIFEFSLSDTEFNILKSKLDAHIQSGDLEKSPSSSPKEKFISPTSVAPHFTLLPLPSSVIAHSTVSNSSAPNEPPSSTDVNLTSSNKGDQELTFMQ